MDSLKMIQAVVQKNLLNKKLKPLNFKNKVQLKNEFLWIYSLNAEWRMTAEYAEGAETKKLLQLKEAEH